jgi:adenylate cyclase
MPYSFGTFLACWSCHFPDEPRLLMLACAEQRKPYLPPESDLLSRNVDVLVVHDDTWLRKFLNGHLWRAGYQVRMARGAIDASGLIAEAAPDVMVLDLDAPAMNCFEFLAGIRADRTIPFFPLVFLTADVHAAGSVRKLGAACVHKPVQPEKLLASVALSTLMRRPQAHGVRWIPKPLN